MEMVLFTGILHPELPVTFPAISVVTMVLFTGILHPDLPDTFPALSVLLVGKNIDAVFGSHCHFFNCPRYLSIADQRQQQQIKCPKEMHISIPCSLWPFQLHGDRHMALLTVCNLPDVLSDAM